ncbi:MAG: hypothetical protein FVQ77_00310 [Cytophagales bacterium]|nr:hypothetical protein [Cytophagales bacterium]
MKKVNLKLIAVAMGFAMAFSFSSCKKYEEGPALSLAGKKGRVVNVWKLDKVFSDGVEVTCDADCQKIRDAGSTEYTKDGKAVWINGSIDPITGNVVTTTANGVWEFSDDKTELMLKLEGSNDFWGTKILKLKSKEMWLGGVTTKDQDPQDYQIYVQK